MDDLLWYFSDVTGVDNERARFHLDAADWDLQVALANFYECVEPSPALEELATAAAAAAAAAGDEPAETERGRKREEVAATGQNVAGKDTPSTAREKNDDEEQRRSREEGKGTAEAGNRPKEGRNRRAETKPRSNVRFGTMDQLQNRESSSDEEGQAFYAGGSEHSGQQVLGPKKKNDIINDMFKSCEGQAIGSSEERPTGQRRNRPNTFGGAGYKLGQTSSDTELVAGGGSTTRGSSSESITARGSASTENNTAGVIMLKLWRDGFTINDREIRSYSEPENREFLAAIKRGEIPQEIQEEVQGGEARLDMEDHRHEEYVAPKPKVKAFTGRGHKLGSPSPATVGMTVPSDPADQAANESRARSLLNVDISRPVTSIQIRLADGHNIRERFNTSHTIGDVRRFVTTMRPQYSLQEFSLLTSYPSRELSREDETIEQAGLQNSAIMQRLK